VHYRLQALIFVCCVCGGILADIFDCVVLFGSSMTAFVVLSLKHCRCESSAGLSDELRCQAVADFCIKPMDLAMDLPKLAVQRPLWRFSLLCASVGVSL